VDLNEHDCQHDMRPVREMESLEIGHQRLRHRRSRELSRTNDVAYGKCRDILFLQVGGDYGGRSATAIDTACVTSTVAYQTRLAVDRGAGAHLIETAIGGNMNLRR
jgi:hypothetical protein